MIITRKIKSKFEPGGRNIFSNVDATNNSVMSGTPRMNSIKQTHTPLRIGRSDWRPSASSIPIGRDSAIPVTPIKTASIKPPNLSDSIASDPIGNIENNIVDNGLTMNSHQISGKIIEAITPDNEPASLFTYTKPTYAIINPANTVIGNQIEPPQINQKQRKGYTAVKYNSFRDAPSNNTGAKARPSRKKANIGRQYNSDG